MSTPSVWVIDVTADTFEQDVILRSKTRPVVVDFWAEWCGPCRALGPVLERLAAEYEGKFVLAKINIDEEQALASSFSVQSIPLVVAFRDGKPANHFLGVLPEAEVKAFVDGLMPTEADHLTEQAAALAASDPAQAEALYRQALADNGPVAARLGLARLLAERGETAEIETLLEPIGGGEEGEEADRIRALVRMRSLKTDGPVTTNPRYTKGCELAAAGRYEEALEELLAAGEADPKIAAGPVREAMVAIFNAVGPTSELANEYRSRLAEMLY
jgi:putative thioredoxin